MSLLKAIVMLPAAKGKLGCDMNVSHLIGY